MNSRNAIGHMDLTDAGVVQFQPASQLMLPVVGKANKRARLLRLGPTEGLGFCMVVDSFHFVSLWVEQECRVVPTVITSQTRGSFVLAAGREARSVKCLDLLFRLRAKAPMTPWVRGRLS